MRNANSNWHLDIMHRTTLSTYIFYTRKMWVAFNLLTMTTICYISKSAATQQPDFILLNSNLTLPCHELATGDKQWKHGENVLFYNKAILDINLDPRVSLGDDYSLFISKVSLSHEGSYQCLQGTHTIAQYALSVQGLCCKLFSHTLPIILC